MYATSTILTCTSYESECLLVTAYIVTISCDYPYTCTYKVIVYYDSHSRVITNFTNQNDTWQLALGDEYQLPNIHNSTFSGRKNVSLSQAHRLPGRINTTIWQKITYQNWWKTLSQEIHAAGKKIGISVHDCKKM